MATAAADSSPEGRLALLLGRQHLCSGLGQRPGPCTTSLQMRAARACMHLPGQLAESVAVARVSRRAAREGDTRAQAGVRTEREGAAAETTGREVPQSSSSFRL